MKLKEAISKGVSNALQMKSIVSAFVGVNDPPILAPVRLAKV